MSINLSIVLKRASKVYHEGDTLAGVVVVECAAEVRHEGLTLLAEGAAALQLAQHQLLDIANTVRSIPLLTASVELAAAGRLPAGRTEIPFEVPLRARGGGGAGGARLLETYHGVFVNVTYALKCTLRRGRGRSFLNKPVNASCQFFIQYEPQEACVVKPVRCVITPASVRAAGAGGGGSGAGGAGGRRALPHFQIYAELASAVCPLDRPITGKIRVEECAAGIKSVELQLVRVETCGGGGGAGAGAGGASGTSRDATEIQNIQVVAGELPPVPPARARDVPLHAVLPRLFTCPTTATHHFKIEFELNIAVIFEDDYLVTENFPILLVRSK